MAIGGVLRNNSGEFIFGFSSNLGSRTIIEAELKAILMGIKLVQLHGYEKVFFDCGYSY